MPRPSPNTRFRQYSLRTLLLFITLAALAPPAMNIFKRLRRPHLEEKLAKIKEELRQSADAPPILWSGSSPINIHAKRVVKFRQSIALLETQIAQQSPSVGEEVHNDRIAALLKQKSDLAKEEEHAAKLQKHIDTYQRLQLEMQRLEKTLAK